jgi:hypothetical protein
MRVKIMEDKTPIYLLSIVGIVALVAVVYVLIGTSSGAPVNTNTNSGTALTGNVVNDNIAPVNIGSIGRFLVGVVLIGGCVYMYRKWE